MVDEHAVCDALQVSGRILTQLPFSEFLSAVDSVSTRASYRNLGSGAEMLRAVESRHGSAALECFARIILSRSLRRTWPGRNQTLPGSIKALMEQHVERINSNLTAVPLGHYRPYHDRFLKDFGICRRQLIPAGAPVLDLDSWLWRGPLRTGTLRQRIRFLELWRRSPFGRGPFYQVHTHTDSLGEFTEVGWNHSYLRIAELLRMNKGMKGFYRASWFCDPLVSKISPRLAYLVRTPTQNGAHLFYLGKDHSGDSLKKSATRLTAYERGEYVPRSYMLVWHRDDLLRWAGSLDET